MSVERSSAGRMGGNMIALMQFASCSHDVLNSACMHYQRPFVIDPCNSDFFLDLIGKARDYVL